MITFQKLKDKLNTQERPQVQLPPLSVPTMAMGVQPAITPALSVPQPQQLSEQAANNYPANQFSTNSPPRQFSPNIQNQQNASLSQQSDQDAKNKLIASQQKDLQQKAQQQKVQQNNFNNIKSFLNKQKA